MNSMPSFAPELLAVHEAAGALGVGGGDLDLERDAAPILSGGRAGARVGLREGGRGERAARSGENRAGAKAVESSRSSWTKMLTHELARAPTAALARSPLLARRLRRASASPPAARRPETPAQAQERRAKASRPTYNLAGYPPAVRDGYIDGCETAKGTRVRRKDAQRFAADPQYSMGWNDGFGICGKK